MIVEIVNLLKKEYLYKQKLASQLEDPYKVLISCLLSLRTKDEVTFKATTKLFQLAKTPEQMSKLKVKDIEKAIYPVGFYKTKARRIKGISKILFDNYNSNVPADFDELLKFNGVGRKTANIVITYGFGKPGIAVDTHVHRISNRLGLVKTKNPHDTEFALKKILPKKYWIVFNKLLVKHGQQTCRPIGPRCFQCVVNDYCKKVGVDKRYYEKI